MNNKGQRRKVLSEEEYTSTLASIVQRDYFPDLPGLQKQAAVLDRREAKDFKGAVAVRRAARRLQDHEEAMADQEAEQEIDAIENSIRDTERPLHRETVSGFHSRVTSEDNQEFEQNLQTEVRGRTSRVEAFYSNPYPTLSSGSNPPTIGRETPLLASDQFNPPSQNIESKTNSKPDNGFFFAPRLPTQNQQSKETKLLKASAEIDMMPPPAPRLNTSAGTIVVSKRDLVEYIPKNALQKYIEPSQTRFPNTIAVVPQQQLQNGHDSSTTDYSTDASTDLDSPNLPLYMERNARVKHRKRELETLVAMTPLIEPGRADDASPITTWGTVSSTPLVLGRYATSSFAIPDENVRDRAAKTAEEKLAKRRAIKSKRTLRPQSSLPRSRLSNLTPAARSLLQKSLPRGSARSASAFSNALRKSYTPQRRKSATRDHAAEATPRTSSSSNKSAHAEQRKGNAEATRSTTSSNLTDGLLDLPSKEY